MIFVTAPGSSPSSHSISNASANCCPHDAVPTAYLSSCSCWNFFARSMIAFVFSSSTTRISHVVRCASPARSTGPWQSNSCTSKHTCFGSVILSSIMYSGITFSISPGPKCTDPLVASKSVPGSAARFSPAGVVLRTLCSVRYLTVMSPLEPLKRLTFSWYFPVDSFRMMLSSSAENPTSPGSSSSTMVISHFPPPLSSAKGSEQSKILNRNCSSSSTASSSHTVMFTSFVDSPSANVSVPSTAM
mmetsp:Transcript_72177/g.145210  ORF Transcript_72177/g.145210 Transcript_72177/m.145210 type:complete len:245 (+) Transcript_72177:1096-1830(+)